MELAQSNKPYHANHSIVYSCQTQAGWQYEGSNRLWIAGPVSPCIPIWTPPPTQPSQAGRSQVVASENSWSSAVTPILSCTFRAPPRHTGWRRGHSVATDGGSLMPEI